MRPAGEAGAGRAVYLGDDSRKQEPPGEGEPVCKGRRFSAWFWDREPWSLWLEGGSRNQQPGAGEMAFSCKWWSFLGSPIQELFLAPAKNFNVSKLPQELVPLP